MRQLLHALAAAAALLQVVQSVEVAVDFSGSTDSSHTRDQKFVRRERRRYDCSARRVLAECPSSREGKAACLGSKVAQGSTKHSPCMWIDADTTKNTPDVCEVDTYDPCYDEDPYDAGRGPGQWPDT
mmetsp:Transcript_33721/g.63073  ORF Transcript_33721/g.63073 Transcript_33721/m.63073 type:complete len:127 (-) Transcript_33721:57-437(-)